MRPSGLSDRQILEALHAVENEGLSRKVAAQKVGATFGQVVGAVQRIKAEFEPSKHDGSLPPRWWEAGLERRGRL